MQAHRCTFDPLPCLHSRRHLSPVPAAARDAVSPTTGRDMEEAGGEEAHQALGPAVSAASRMAQWLDVLFRMEPPRLRFYTCAHKDMGV